MPATRKHDPEDACRCSYCGILEDIHLLDGVLDENGHDTGKLGCIKCYPTDSWCPTGVEHIQISIAPSLKPHYEAWLVKEDAKDFLRIANQRLDLLKWGFKVGDRDPRLNTNYPGKFMVVEHHEESELPTKDGSNGPWCIVGDDLNALINEAHRVWWYEYDGEKHV